ncbi:MAG: ATP-binding cassette domain-containing protein [Lentisphaeraceae bacterium]|nr:ATP-binding cassette domain-containing protein [Lentisphaeraceae bacterium]
MLSINDLKFTYPDDNSFAINLTDFKLEQGDSLAVCGPSGTGKSTLLSLIAGTLSPNQGIIQYNETLYSELSKSSLKKLRLNEYGTVFQQAELIEWMSVKDNILLPQKFAKNPKYDPQHLNDLIEKAGLAKLLKKNGGSLSIGEQMRVSLVRALAGKPKLILADEPTASLDPSLRQTIIDMLIAKSKKTNATLIVVSHDDFVVNKMSKKISSEDWVIQ